MRKRHVARWVLNQDLAAQHILRFIDAADQTRQVVRVERYRQQVRIVPTRMVGPGQMFGNQRRLEPVDEPPQRVQMVAVEPVRSGHRQADTMQRQRIVVPQRLELAQARAAIDKVVLGMHLEPALKSAVVLDLSCVLGFEADARHRADGDIATGKSGGARAVIGVVGGQRGAQVSHGPAGPGVIGRREKTAPGVCPGAVIT